MKKITFLVGFFMLFFVLNFVSAADLKSRLSGRIVLKVEDAGKAYYINPRSKNINFLGRPSDAFQVMRREGVGIKNSDLYKIPVGISGDGIDSDNDGLSDNLEKALGLNSSKQDTDNDGHDDKTELNNGFNPWGEGVQSLDNSFSEKQQGLILLQVEKNGEAWYVNPVDNKRYFLGRPSDAFGIMRKMGLGMSNKDFDKLDVEEISVNKDFYPDNSIDNPIDINIYTKKDDFSIDAEDRLRHHLAWASKGKNFENIEDCEGNPYCVGGYAAAKEDEKICENYEFEYIYYMISMCGGSDDCGYQRISQEGNSVFEKCYIGYGAIIKNEEMCEELKGAQNQRNVPDYSDDKSTSEELKIESCNYGVAMGKNNYKICEITDFYKDTCYYNFAFLNKTAELCEKVVNENSKNSCLRRVVPMSGDYKQCFEISAPIESNFVYQSNIEVPENEKVNEETKDVDSCIAFTFSENKLTDLDICEEIVSPKYKYSCKFSYASRFEDHSLCSMEFLASEGYVNRCLFDQAVKQKNISLCDKQLEYKSKGVALSTGSDSCQVRYSIAVDDFDLCLEHGERDECLESFAYKRDDLEFCQQIEDESTKTHCITLLAQFTENLELCNLLSDVEDEDGGYSDRGWCIYKIE